MVEPWNPKTDGENGSEKDLWWIIPTAIVIFAVLYQVGEAIRSAL